MSAYIVNASTWFLIALGIYATFCVLRDAIKRKSFKPDPNYYTSSDPRCEQTRLKQEKARQFMERQGIKTLLDGKPAWQRMVPMGKPEEFKKVVHLRRKP